MGHCLIATACSSINCLQEKQFAVCKLLCVALHAFPGLMICLKISSAAHLLECGVVVGSAKCIRLTMYDKAKSCTIQQYSLKIRLSKGTCCQHADYYKAPSEILIEHPKCHMSFCTAYRFPIPDENCCICLPAYFSCFQCELHTECENCPCQEEVKVALHSERGKANHGSNL